jgi:hypothetical protein
MTSALYRPLTASARAFVVRIAARAHRTNFGQSLGVSDGEILCASVTVVDQTGEALPLAAPDGDRECIECQISVKEFATR